jgi:hypothetical protein
MHPRNVFLPAARIPSHAITTVDWSQAGVPYKLSTPLTPQVAFTGFAQPQPMVPSWQVKDPNLTGSRIIVSNARMRKTRVVQQPQARGFKKTP